LQQKGVTIVSLANSMEYFVGIDLAWKLDNRSFTVLNLFNNGKVLPCKYKKRTQQSFLYRTIANLFTIFASCCEENQRKFMG
jgi:predicted RNase H-like nuclease